MRQIIEDHPDADFILHNGAKNLIKRKKFEEFIDSTSRIWYGKATSAVVQW